MQQQIDKEQELGAPAQADPADNPEAEQGPRKLPPWAIPIAVLAFIIFNAFFFVFAAQLGSGAAD